jgi:probable HAF family extracellular repeat protein
MPIFAYTTLDDPAASRGTFATGINAAGQVVGSYTDASGDSHGFIYAGGGYANFDDPNAGNGGDTLPDGINNLGQIVGTYINFPQEYGFIKIGNSYPTIINPNNVNNATLAHGINSSGEVVGEYTDAAGTHGFVYLRDLGVFAPFYDPGPSSVILNGINENGTLMVGQEGGGGSVPHGFLWNGAFFVILRDPFAAGANGTNAKGVNDSGQVVGYYFDAGGRTHGFFYSGGSSGGLSSGTFTTIDVGARGTVINGINDAGQMVGFYIDSLGHDHGFVGSFQPNPAPSGGTTAAMILRGANSSAAIAGQYEIYDIGNNAILSAYLLGQAGTDFQFAGLGRFFDGDTVDMMLRSGSTGAFEVYDISNNNITNAASLGAIGLNWQVAGFADFNGDGMSDMMMRNSGSGAFQVYNISNNSIINSSPVGTVGLDWQVGGFGNFSSAGESDMIMRNTKTGALEVYDINNNQITTAVSIGMVGLDWQFSGVGNFSSNPGETDLLMRNGKTGGLEVYDIANNQLTGAAFLGTVGLDWQFAGIAPVHAAGAADLVLRNVNTGAFEVYDIASNQLTGAAPLGSVGLDWQLGGLGVDPPVDNAGDAGALVQAMAGFGGIGGAADGFNAASLDIDVSQQFLAAPPQYA